MRPLIACDLGASPAFALVTGTEDCPVLIAVRRFPKWDSQKVVRLLKAWLRGRGKGGSVWCEQTFTGPKWLRDVGRKQEAQAGFLAGMLWGPGGAEVKRVPPVTGAEAFAAWDRFGRPKRAATEHEMDALGVALKALIRRAPESARNQKGG